MADNIVIPINKTVDISQGTLHTTLGLQNTQDQLIQGQSYANVLNVSVYDGDAPVELSGECMGYFVRQQDGSTVTVAGTISGNVASVEFPSFVYAYTGRLTITLNVGGTSLVQIATTVRLGATMVVVDPGNVLPNLDEIQQIMLDVENALNQLSSALEDSQDATQAANSAAGAANTAAGQATTAASSASTAAGAANTAAQTATTAAQKIDGMTVSATGLTAGSSPTAAISEQGGAKHIAFGIPKGDTGATGATGATPDITIGTVTTGEPGTDAAATMTGTPKAPVLNLTIPRGLPGEGAVSSVDGVMPGTGGDVLLHAVRYDAQTLTDTQQAQARENIGAGPPGRVLSFSLPASEWAGSGPYTCAISESSATAKTAVVECVLTAATRANQLADIDWTTSAGSIALSTTVKPTGELAGYMILTEVQ